MNTSLLQVARQRRLIALASLNEGTDNILAFDTNRTPMRKAANAATFATRRATGAPMLKAA
ncbi:MAG: hypothetical protein AAGP08_15455 [Pseudomonadota bacterium]